jgi:SAM-dependent methyltransferase
VALDYSEEMIAVARENAAAAGYSNVTFVHGDAGEISSLLAGQRFDFAVCNSAFWHFPDPEKAAAGLRQLLTESGEFALSLPAWGDSNPAAREAFRAKLRQVLLKNGVTEEEIDNLSAQRTRKRADITLLLQANGFAVRDFPFEFRVSPESREAWRKITVFSDLRQWNSPFPNLDPATQQKVRDEMGEWRKTLPPRDPGLSRWRMIVAGPSTVQSKATGSSPSV